MASERELDGGDGHAVLRPQRLHNAHVGEEELNNARVIVLYGDLDDGVAIADDRGVASPVLEEEFGHLIVAFKHGPGEGGIAVIGNIGRMIARKSDEVLDDGDVIAVAGTHDGVPV